MLAKEYFWYWEYMHAMIFFFFFLVYEVVKGLKSAGCAVSRSVTSEQLARRLDCLEC